MKRIVCVICALVLISCSQPKDLRPLPAQIPEANIPIHLVSHGWHVGLVLPAQPFNALLSALAQRFPQANAYELGWGDDGFYQSDQQTRSMALSALFVSKGAVMHVVSIEEAPQVYFDGLEIVTLCLDEQQLKHLLRFVANSFMQPQMGELIKRESGRYGDSQFYQANGRYSMMHTCNRWTAEALDKTGMDLPYRLMLTSGSVMRAARKKGQSCELD